MISKIKNNIGIILVILNMSTTPEFELKLVNEYIENGEKIIDNGYFKSIEDLKILSVLFEKEKILTPALTIEKKKYEKIAIIPNIETMEKINRFLEGLEFLWIPGEIFFAGGALNLILDPTIDETHRIYEKSDIDIFITGTIERKKELFNLFIEDLRSKYTIEKIEYIGSVCNIKLEGVKRTIQVILCKTGQDEGFVKEFDYPHLKTSYDGNQIIMYKDSWKAITSRISGKKLRPELDDRYYRLSKNLQRNYIWGDKHSKIHKNRNMYNNIDFVNVLIAAFESPPEKEWIPSTLAEIYDNIKYEGVNHLVEGY